MFDTKPLHGGLGRRGQRALPIALAGLALLAFFAWVDCVRAATAAATSNDSLQGTSSTAARKSAVQSIPFDKLDADSRAKIDTVLNSASIFRRLPVRTVTCDPDLYLFLVRHPDVVVNIWEILGVAQVQVRQADIDTFRVAEPEGTAANMEFLFHSHDTQIVCGTWTYTGSLLSRKINGRCLAILRSNYTKDANGKYCVTARMDGFLSVDSGAAELVARTLQPLMVKNVDNNFIQTIAFLGSLSKTAEVNPQGLQRLTDRLTNVQESTRQQLGEVVHSVSQRAAAGAAKPDAPSRVATRPPEARE